MPYSNAPTRPRHWLIAALICIAVASAHHLDADDADGLEATAASVIDAQQAAQLAANNAVNAEARP